MWNEDGDPVDPGMDCLQLRQPAGPFHYLISEQAKSLVALQELQHEVGALLEFRDLVMETFPNLRTKLAASTPATMMTSPHHLHHSNSNIPVSIRPGDWTPGVRVRKKIGSKDEGRSKKGDIAVQDSGFSTETSSKETHSASSTAPPPSSTAAGGPDEAEDELWNLLDIIHRKGTRLKHEAEALQGTIRQQGEKDGTFRQEQESTFQRVLFHSSVEDVRQLRQERDNLLDRLAEMEAEVHAGRVHTSRLQEDLEALLSAKQDLEEQLKAVVTQRGEVNSRIHDLHLQFVTKSASTDSSEKINRYSVGDRRDSSSSSSSSQRTNRKSVVSELDSALGDKLPKVSTAPDGKKISAILREHDPLVLQKHLLMSTVQNQAFQEQLDSAVSLEIELRDKLDRFREENDDLRFQLEDKSIELEGTRARVRLLEDLQKPLTKSSSPDIIPVALDTTPPGRPPSRTEISTASMKAMCPLTLSSMKAIALNLDHSSSTESAHDQSAEKERRDSAGKSRRPSKIPLKSYTAPKPPGGKHSPAPGTRNRSGDSPGRPHSAQSWRNNNNRSESNNSLSGSKSNTSLSKSRNSSLVTAKDSLSSKLRSTDSLPKKTGGSHAKKDAPVGEKIPNSSSAKGRSRSPWILSSYNSDPEANYPDSLDKTDSIQLSVTENSNSHRFHTANTFLWTVSNPRAKIEFYDSIDTNMASSLFHVNGEELAECDSLERHLSDFSDKK